MTSPFSNTHVIAHFPTNTITYKEPTIPHYLNIELKKNPMLFISTAYIIKTQ
jgi:hypothetical protein